MFVCNIQLAAELIINYLTVDIIVDTILLISDRVNHML